MPSLPLSITAVYLKYLDEDKSNVNRAVVRNILKGYIGDEIVDKYFPETDNLDDEETRREEDGNTDLDEQVMAEEIAAQERVEKMVKAAETREAEET